MVCIKNKAGSFQGTCNFFGDVRDQRITPVFVILPNTHIRKQRFFRSLMSDRDSACRMKHLKPLSIRGVEISLSLRSATVLIKDYRIVDSLSSSLKK